MDEEKHARVWGLLKPVGETLAAEGVDLVVIVRDRAERERGSIGMGFNQEGEENKELLINTVFAAMTSFPNILGSAQLDTKEGGFRLLGLLFGAQMDWLESKGYKAALAVEGTKTLHMFATKKSATKIVANIFLKAAQRYGRGMAS